MKRLQSFILIFCIGAFFGTGLPAQKQYDLFWGREGHAYVSELLKKLSLEEKTSLLAGMGTSRSEFGDKDVPYFGIKGIPEKGVPDYIMGHGITGVRTGRDLGVHSTFFCTPAAMASSWDLDLYGRVGTAIAREMRGLGQDLNLGPTVNIYRHPLGGRNWECLSEDPFLTARFIVPYVKAMQTNGIVCGPKHYVANNQDHNRFDINNELSERTLREIYLPAFKAAVMEGGALNIMGSYNRLNGVFMCQNQYLLTDILRGEWGFDGFVLSDFGNGLRSTLAGVYGGLNVEMSGPKFYGKALLEEVQNGAVSRIKIDSMLYDVLKTMYIMDIFNRPRYENKELVHCADHQAIAAEVARKSPVLLKNEKKILPLSAKKLKSVAVIGPQAVRYPGVPPGDVDYAYYLQGGGSGRTYYFAEAIVDPLTGLTRQLEGKAAVKYAQGCQTPDIFRNNKPAVKNATDDKLIKEAVDLARQSDVAVLYVGLSGFNESEAWDRTSAGLPGFQEKLIQEVAKVNKKTVVVLIAGSYVDVSPWIDQVSALLYVPYCGEKLGEGVADILLGNVSPSGKLSISWPASLHDYPGGSHLTGPGYTENGVSNVYSEGIYVGYRWFEKENIPVSFAFGYGQSYSSFEYSDIRVEKTGDFSARVNFSLKNTGKMKAAEVCQLYIHDLVSDVDRPLQELKGFLKVELAPGEEQNCSISLDKAAFSYFHPEKNSWVAESGEFEIRVGAGSQQILLSEKISF